LSLDRTVTPALFDSQVTENTSLLVGLNQRLFEKFTFNGSVGYNIVDYLASSSIVPSNVSPATSSQPGRHDTGYSLTAGLSWAFVKRASVAATYTYSQNYSTAPGFTFASSQAGLTLTYTF
jgi:opacity protein-like surface antigen